MMSKKHFQLFANAIAQIDNDINREETICLVGSVLKADNNRFDMDRFREWIKRVRNNEDLKGLR